MGIIQQRNAYSLQTCNSRPNIFQTKSSNHLFIYLIVFICSCSTLFRYSNVPFIKHRLSKACSQRRLALCRKDFRNRTSNFIILFLFFVRFSVTSEHGIEKFQSKNHGHVLVAEDPPLGVNALDAFCTLKSMSSCLLCIL